MSHRIVTSLTVILAGIMAATPAFAYVGPGAGLTLLGALWGLLIAVGATLAFVILWPLRKMFRKKQPVPAVAARQSEPNAERRD